MFEVNQVIDYIIDGIGAIPCTVVERRINPSDQSVWVMLQFKSGKTVKKPEDVIQTIEKWDEWDEA
tara:strand:- start:193 stop:390 length:198 start_codon:yes stop_codon:yes gene_type:complete